LCDTDFASDRASFGHQEIAGGYVTFEQTIDDDRVGDHRGAAHRNPFANVKGV